MLTRIHCYHCHQPMTVDAAQSGQFRCPHCQAINTVGAPMPAPVPNLGPAPRRPESDSRWAWVLGAFVALGGAALALGWWGIGLGAGVLAWAIAGALGKLPGPVALLFPDSARKVLLAATSIALGGFVTMCGVMGGVGTQAAAARETAAAEAEAEAALAAETRAAEREALAAEARSLRETELLAKVDVAASDYERGLGAVEALLAEGKTREAEAKLVEVAAAVADYRGLDPIPAAIEALSPRHVALTASLEAARQQREIIAWVTRAEAVVLDPSRCEDPGAVAAAREQVAGLSEAAPEFAAIEELNAKLDACAAAMPPASEWRYASRDDPMGGSVVTASVASSNSLEFDFPYQGSQTATLLLRDDDGLDVLVIIERGQFICTMGCAVTVRFDDGPVQRWRATGPSDYSSTTIFLRNPAKFVKQLGKARVARVEASFFQEGSQVLEFPVARLDEEHFE